MKNRKLFIALTIIFCFALAFSACGKKDTVIKNDVSVDDLVKAVEGKFDSEGLQAMDDSYIAGSLGITDTSKLDGYVVKINVYGTNINEYGIFKAADEASAKALDETVKSYLKMRNETWMKEYMPEEYPKLESAKSEQDGVYVFYTILADADREAFVKEFRSQINAK
ncbi:MAG: DUF4358 domain-containing protein [Oscillospiraceae bacterium]|nr:DUF4358 domain-containing protein [Oscillospiraceae bacterium]